MAPVPQQPTPSETITTDASSENNNVTITEKIYTRVPKMNIFINNKKFNKKKVVFIMGATRTGKSRLSVDLAIFEEK
ncbi:hypothetical protein KY284_033303 [Solanum tuberosum]|nr:hypothetical protein KY284_033303 [Solanum tuberosum]